MAGATGGSESRESLLCVLKQLGALPRALLQQRNCVCNDQNQPEFLHVGVFFSIRVCQAKVISVMAAES